MLAWTARATVVERPPIWPARCCPLTFAIATLYIGSEP